MMGRDAASMYGVSALRDMDGVLPMAFPVAQMMKFVAMATDFLVWPATFREMRDSDRV